MNAQIHYASDLNVANILGELETLLADLDPCASSRCRNAIRNSISPDSEAVAATYPFTICDRRSLLTYLYTLLWV